MYFVWEDNIKVDFKAVRWEDVEWVQLGHDKSPAVSLCEHKINILCSIISRHFWTADQLSSFQRYAMWYLCHCSHTVTRWASIMWSWDPIPVLLQKLKQKLLMIYLCTVCKMGNNKSVILLNLYLRDCCTKYRCNGNQQTSWNLIRPACNRMSVYLPQYLTNLIHKICFTIRFISCLYMFQAHVLKTCRGIK